MKKRIDFRNVVPERAICGDDDEDTRLLHSMLEEAKAYLKAFHWCRAIREAHFGIGVGAVVAVFLFRIDPARTNVDEWVWVVVGDLPPAYIAIENAANPIQALSGYVGEMKAWVEAVHAGKDVKHLIPVNVPATREHARLLDSRLDFIKHEFIDQHPEDMEKQN